MAKKLNQSLLNEELKRFKLLSEFTFFNEEPKKEDDLILGAVDEADEEPTDDAAADAPVDDSKTAANAGDEAGTEGDDASNLFSTDDAGAGDTGADDAAAGEAGATDAETGADDAGAGEMGADDMGVDDMGTEEPAGDEVEVDVTSLVKGSEEAKKSADLSFLKTTELLSKFNDLEQRVAAMDSISSKIDTLEKEIVKRNPTPVEKLEMRSMSSFPYNIKLTDYWKDVPGYDTGNDASNEEPKEYVLTKDDVDNTYTDASIKDTFNLRDDDYEEEDY